MLAEIHENTFEEKGDRGDNNCFCHAARCELELMRGFPSVDKRT